MKTDLAQRAVDNAFINHVGKLFESLNAGMLTEMTETRDIHNATPAAADRFAKGFNLARQTHKVMSDHIAAVAKDGEL